MFTSWRTRDCGSALTTSAHVAHSRQPPHACAMRRNSSYTQRRAAPMPRVAESVSDMVCRVPNDTSLRTSASMRAADAPAAISWMRGSSDDGTAAAARRARRRPAARGAGTAAPRRGERREQARERTDTGISNETSTGDRAGAARRGACIVAGRTSAAQGPAAASAPAARRRACALASAPPRGPVPHRLRSFARRAAGAQPAPPPRRDLARAPGAGGGRERRRAGPAGVRRARPGAGTGR
jgi:hypothetical protein